MIITRASLTKALLYALLSFALCLLLGAIFHGEIVRTDMMAGIGTGIAQVLLHFGQPKPKS